MITDQLGNPRLLAQHGEIHIYENSQYRWLCFDDEQALQSCMLKADPAKLVLPYQHCMMLWPLFQKQHVEKACFIGLGGGDLVRYFQSRFPQIQLHAVDHNAAMVRLATEYFSLKPEANTLTIEVADAEQFLTKNITFDLVFIDIVNDNSMPECLFKPAFWASCAQSLNKNGIVLVNCIVDSETVLMTVLKVLQQCFGYVPVCMDVPDHKNIVLVVPVSETQIPTPEELQKYKRVQNADDISYQNCIDILLESNRNRFGLP